MAYRTSLEGLPLEPLITPELASHPQVVFERLRAAHGAVAPVDVLGVPVWLVLGYREALEVLRNEGLWRKDIRHWKAFAEGRIPLDSPLVPVHAVGHVANQDGPAHRRLRGAWGPSLEAFEAPARPQAIRLRMAVTRYADGLLDVLSPGRSREGWADLCGQYARPLSLMVVGRLLGLVDEEDDDMLMDAWRVLDAGPDSFVAAENLLAALGKHAAEKRARPGEDFPSYLLAVEPSLTFDELCQELMMLISVVGDCTTHLISNTVAEVLTGGGGARDGLSVHQMGEIINRVAMANPPLANLPFRFAATTTRLGSYAIAAGDPVMVSVAAAHSDPVFGGGMAGEALVSSRAHLAWGAGPHHCPGRDLATTVTTIALTRLFERFSRIELDIPGGQLTWRPSPLMRGPEALPARLELARDPVAEVRVTDAFGGSDVARLSPAWQRHRSSLWRFLTELHREA
ncbi:cytochrome [Streptomyces sp. NBC_00829]|uniref:cytochrome n=1 Tax=Streptomyces sp. NBC_00829 TaxID=2903679 RepID=UPI00386FA3A7|nr:cytochrome P450 [Streptomyces sp. NBC_00829]